MSSRAMSLLDTGATGHWLYQTKTGYSLIIYLNVWCYQTLGILDTQSCIYLSGATGPYIWAIIGGATRHWQYRTIYLTVSGSTRQIDRYSDMLKIRFLVMQRLIYIKDIITKRLTPDSSGTIDGFIHTNSRVWSEFWCKLTLRQGFYQP